MRSQRVYPRWVQVRSTCKTSYQVGPINRPWKQELRPDLGLGLQSLQSAPLRQTWFSLAIRMRRCVLNRQKRSWLKFSGFCLSDLLFFLFKGSFQCVWDQGYCHIGNLCFCISVIMVCIPVSVFIFIPEYNLLLWAYPFWYQTPWKGPMHEKINWALKLARHRLLLCLYMYIAVTIININRLLNFFCKSCRFTM